MTLYLLLKFLHVLLAAIALGFNASYPIWLNRAQQEPEHALYALRGIKTMDDRFANPAYGLLLVLGLAMVFMGGYSFATFWIAAALVLYVLLILGGLLLYTPALKGQIAALESGGPTSPEFARLGRRSALIGGLLGLDVVVIIFLMVVKPTL